MISEQQRLHRLLSRQIRKSLLDKSVNKEQLQHLIHLVNEAYHDYDEQRMQLERILEISGKELYRANQQLQEAKKDLEKKIEERAGDLIRINQQLNDEIAERKIIEQQLKKAIDSANAANQAKALFLSSMSHEIRTPMHAIIGLTDLLLSEEDSKDKKEHLESIRFASENLMVIINDILDFSRIEAGKLKLESIAFSPRSIVTHVIKTLGYNASEKGLQVRLIYDEYMPRVLKGDPTRLNQILMNLVGNAIKFTAKGFVEIRVKLTKRISNQVVIQMEVEDSGIGIDQEKLESIFDSFSQASIETSRIYGGSGLGLTIAKRLIDMQKGQISVASAPGTGTIFTVVLPFEVSLESPEIQDGLEFNSNKNLSDLSILMVEDNKMNQYLSRQMLGHYKNQPDVADNGRIGFEMYCNKRYDLILMDLQMPEMDGMDATRAIRSYEEKHGLKPVPILALTADAFPQTREKVTLAGMNAYISKPFSREELLQVILIASGRIRDNE